MNKPENDERDSSGAVGCSAWLGHPCDEFMVSFSEMMKEATDKKEAMEMGRSGIQSMDVVGRTPTRLLLISVEVVSLAGLPLDQHHELQKRAMKAQMSRARAHTLLHPQPQEFRLQEQPEDNDEVRDSRASNPKT